MELIRKIRKKYHREIAMVQDLIIETIYAFFPNIILHGGTLIWRCFNGNRFSEDLHFYLSRKNEKMIKKFFDELKKQGFEVKKLRIKERSVVSKISFNKIEIRIEIVFKKERGILLDYECLDGRKIPIKGLPPEKLIEEKANAFIERKKIRDLYDIYFLLKFVEKNEKIKKLLLKLVKNFEKPKDEKELEKIILFGYSPSSQEIIEYIKRWIK